MKAIPNKFSFFHAGTTQRYDMEKQITQWRCTPLGASTHRSCYSEYEIREHIADGDWWVIPEEPEMAMPKEPPLVFPFKYKHSSEGQYGTVHKGKGGSIEVVIFDVYDGEYFHCCDWMEEDAKRWIKDGTWIVTSVGEQKAPEAPKASILGNSTLTINVDTKAATEAVNALAEAGNKAAEAMLVLKSAIEDVASVLNGGGFVKELKDNIVWPDLDN